MCAVALAVYHKQTGDSMRYHDLTMAVKEMIERHWDVYQIASKLRIDPIIIQQIIDALT